MSASAAPSGGGGAQGISPAARESHRSRAGWIAMLVALWLAAVLAGGALLWRYSTTSGEFGGAPRAWPEAPSISRSFERWTLLVFAHPRCPCTRATLHELARLLASCPGRVATQVLMVTPTEADPAWTQSDTWAQARAIPEVVANEDRGGQIAKVFGARTSGQVALYDRRGELRFQGGLTASRGEQGDNAGSRAIESLLIDGESDRATTPVFGCPLFDPDVVCAGCGAEHEE